MIRARILCLSVGLLAVACHPSRPPRDATLLNAAMRNDAATIKAEAAKGTSMDAQGRSGQTALHWAATNRSYEAAVALLDAGANPNIRNDSMTTPLIDAAGKGDVRISQALLAHHADVNARNRRGNTPLLEAAQAQNPALVRMLLAAGAQKDAVDNRGNTAESLCKGNPEIMAILRGEK